MLKIKTKLNGKTLIILGMILVIGLIMRVYNFEKSFAFAHDQDLYSWIAKDIVVNKHIRTVGQITSVDGVFIGPLYYYMMAFVYFLFGMNPISAIVPLTVIGLLTIVSFFILGKKYFSERVGIIMAFIYAVSYGAASYDKWSCPTELAILWTVWFLYLIFGMFRKNLKLMPLFGVLAGLTYHIHIALIPVLPIPILAYFMSGGKFGENLKKIKIKNVLVTLLLFMLVSSPFWIFELKHNFSQVRSVITASQKDLGQPVGFVKFKKVINASAIEIQQRLLIGLPIKPVEIIWPIFLLITYIVYKFKKIKGKELIAFFVWFFIIGLAQYTSKRIVSEYYFTNYLAIFVVIISLFLDIFLGKKYLDKIILGIGGIYLIANFIWLVKITNQNNDSYLYKKQLVEYIKTDQLKNGYPCIGINYVAKFGDGVGFRYLFWYKGVEIIKPSGSVPTYNVIIPWETSASEISEKFGRFGVVLPVQKEASNDEWCKAKENQLDPLLGYTE
jgi:4-amino-4-deoxy-L-arabinose transferase-like glycosyltransferase